MGVGVEREAGGEMAEHTADRLDVHAILEGDGCEGVAEVVESDFRDACPCQYSFEHIVHAVRRNGATVRRGEDVGVIRFRFLLF